MAGNVHVEDVGTIYRVIVKNQDGAIVDISGATTKQILFQGPGVFLTKTASFPSGGDGTDGAMEWIGLVGDITTKGKWKYQGFVILPSGEWHTTTIDIPVLDFIKAKG